MGTETVLTDGRKLKTLDSVRHVTYRGGYLARYGVCPTYRCNLSCKYCNRFLDKVPWPDSDMELGDVAVAGERLRRANFVVTRIRFTGGEPLMHPRFAELARSFQKEWTPTMTMHSFTNNVLPQVKDAPVRFHGSGSSNHLPWMISPTDLGMATNSGYVTPCYVQWSCGRLFDAFGFSFCVHAGSLGRLFGIDPYHGYPVLLGLPELCRHCICSLPRKKQFLVQKAFLKGEEEYPTKTYKRLLGLRRSEPMTFPRFRSRL